MKKCWITGAILLVSLVLDAQADRVIKGTKPISRELTPQEVVDSLKAKFPNATAVQYYEIPPGGVDNGWAISDEDTFTGEDADFYTIRFKSDNLKYYALYHRDGTLLGSRTEETSTNLPDAVKTSLQFLSTQFPGYRLDSQTYYKTRNLKKSKEYYEVVAKKGTATKTIFYAPDGTIVKEKNE